MSLHALQNYFDAYVFTFDPDDDVDVISCQYEKQAEFFLRYLGAMMSVEQFVTLVDDKVVYARCVPPGMKSVEASLCR